MLPYNNNFYKAFKFILNMKPKIAVIAERPLHRYSLVASVAKLASSIQDFDKFSYPEMCNFKPELIITEFDLNRNMGFGNLREINSFYPKNNIIVASYYDDPTFFCKFMKYANGLISLSKDNVEDIVPSVMNNEIGISKELSQKILDSVNVQKQIPFVYFKPAELEIFISNGLGLTTKEIAANLHLSNSTIDTYKKFMINKLVNEAQVRESNGMYCDFNYPKIIIPKNGEDFVLSKIAVNFAKYYSS